MKRGYFLWFFTVIVLAGLIYFLSRIGLNKIYELIGQANLLFLLLSCISLFFMFFLWNCVMVISLRSIDDKKIPFFSTLPITFSGIFFNTITPGARVGGEPIRTYYLSKKYKGRKSVYLAGVLFQKLLNYIAHFSFLIFSLILVLFLFKFSRIKFIFSLILFLIIFILLLILILILSRKKIEKLIRKISFIYIFFSKKFENKKKFTEYLIKRYRHFSSTFNRLLKNKTLLVKLLVLSFSSRIFFYLTAFFVFLSLGIEFPFIYIIISTTFILFFEDLSGIPGGIGLAEAGLIVIYGLFGLSPVSSASVSLLSRSVYYFYALVVGIISFVYLRIKYN